MLCCHDCLVLNHFLFFYQTLSVKLKKKTFFSDLCYRAGVKGGPSVKWENSMKYMRERRFGPNEEGVLKQGELEGLMPWPFPFRVFLEEMKCQGY